MFTKWPAKLRRTLLFLLSFILLLWAGEAVFPSNSHMNFDIQSHSLNIQLDPSTHIIKAEDQMEILLKEGFTVRYREAGCLC
jgi:hypothetical protein